MDERAAAAKDDRQMVYQMYMNGAHNGDEFIQSGFEFWMNRTLGDLNHWAAIHGADPESFRAVLHKARETEQSFGASNGAHVIWKFFLGLIKEGR